MESKQSRKFSDIPIMWTPHENSGMTMKNFMKKIEKKYSKKFDGYWDFHQWSVDNVADFWAEIWDLSGIIYSQKYHKVIDLSLPMEKSAQWFEGAKLNYAENLLKYRDDDIALIIAGEDREKEFLTHNQMYEETCLYAAAFRKMGLKKGDVAVGYISNRKEAVLAMFAVASIGGIWSGALPQMGPQAVLNRLSQVNPKILLTIDRFQYNREEVEMLKNVEEIVKGLPTLEKVIIVPSKKESKLKNIQNIRNSCFLDDFLESGRESDGSVSPMKFEQVPVSYPLFISFTSGTTGLPKPLIHGTGMLFSVVKDYTVHCDSTRDSVWMSISPVGWATWNMCTTLLFLSLKLLLFEGYPYFLNPTSFWDLVDEFKITHYFPPASVADELQKRKSIPTEKHDLSTLKIFMCGGSVVKPSLYDFMYKDVKAKFAFSSGYGSTELMGSCFLLEQTLPVYRGEINAISLGYSFECLDEKGRNMLGEPGEMVITKSVPNLPLGIWGDEDGLKFREKYFSKYPGKFMIGDNAIINPVSKGVIICGRSDDTLKQRGCRFGSSEIYNVVEKFPEVFDSLCVSQYNADMDERAVLFLKMREGFTFSQQLIIKIRDSISKELTPRHIPDIIIEAKDIPYNMNGKKMEILVKNIINNKPFNTEAVSNPESLKCYKNRTELQGF